MQLATLCSLFLLSPFEQPFSFSMHPGFQLFVYESCEENLFEEELFPLIGVSCENGRQLIQADVGMDGIGLSITRQF